MMLLDCCASLLMQVCASLERVKCKQFSDCSEKCCF